MNRLAYTAASLAMVCLLITGELLYVVIALVALLCYE